LINGLVNKHSRSEQIIAINWRCDRKRIQIN